VNEQLGWLIRLQELDSQIDRLREKREQLPQAIEEARQPIEKTQAEYVAGKAAYESQSLERRNKERDLATLEEKLKKLQDRTTGIKTNKEYQAHLAEIETGKKEKSNLEEALLILMDQADVSKKEIEGKEKLVAEEKSRFEKERQRMESDMVAAEETLKQLEQESKTIVGNIEAPLLKEYQKLRTTRKGLAVVPVNERTCMGCRLSVRPQLIADLRKDEKVLTCSHCHRYLYLPTPA
jgi:uncharacterized protein